MDNYPSYRVRQPRSESTLAPSPKLLVFGDDAYTLKSQMQVYGQLGYYAIGVLVKPNAWGLEVNQQLSMPERNQTGLRFGVFSRPDIDALITRLEPDGLVMPPCSQNIAYAGLRCHIIDPKYMFPKQPQSNQFCYSYHGLPVALSQPHREDLQEFSKHHFAAKQSR